MNPQTAHLSFADPPTTARDPRPPLPHRIEKTS